LKNSFLWNKKREGGGGGKKFKKKEKKKLNIFFLFPQSLIYIYNSYMIHIELSLNTMVGLGLIVIGLLLYALRITELNVFRGVFLGVP